MRRWSVAVWVVACSLSCAEGPVPERTPYPDPYDYNSPGGSGPGGSGGVGQGGGGAGGSGVGGAGGSAGSGGTGAGGMGGAGGAGGTGGAGGAGGAGGIGGVGGGEDVEFLSMAGCTYGAGQRVTSVAFAADGSLSYEPPCIRVARGGTITIAASAIHPLNGMRNAGTAGSPIDNVPGGAYFSDASITFPSPGTFGFYCVNHGTDSASSAGFMVGVIYVE